MPFEDPIYKINLVYVFGITIVFLLQLISIQTNKVDNDTQFSISDDGTGIKEEVVDELFKIESKYSQEGTNGEKGTGLGMILCRDFIGQHNGRIWIISNYSKGSTFKLTIPDPKWSDFYD